MVHVDMRELPAAAQKERRRQVVGLRESGLTYDAIAVQTGLTRNRLFRICRRHAERGLSGLASGPRGPAPGTGRFLTPQQAEIGSLICRHFPNALGLSCALWNREAMRAPMEQRCGVRLAPGRQKCAQVAGQIVMPHTPDSIMRRLRADPRTC